MAFFTGTNNSSMVQVGVSMVLQDRFTAESNRISGSFNDLMGQMVQWQRGINMSIGSAVTAGLNLTKGMFQVYEYSAGVANEIFLASKIAGATAAEQAQLMQTAKDINAITPLTAADVASGERYLAMAGNSAKQIQDMIGPAAKLASILGAPLGGKGGVADLMTNIMSMYVIPSERAAAVTDDLYTAVTNANISLTDLAQSIAYAGGDMANAGFDLRQTAAAIGVLGDMGIQGSSAGTALANMIRYLQLSLAGQKKKGVNMLEYLGLNPQEFLTAEGNLIDLMSIYQKFGKAMEGLNTLERTRAFYNIFGIRGTRDISQQIRNMISGSSKFGTIMGKYDQNIGAVDIVNEEKLKTSSGAIDALRSSIENLTVTVGQQLKVFFDPMVKAAGFMVRLVDRIAKDGFGGWIIRLGAGFTIIQTMIQGFRLIHGTVRMISAQFTLLTGAQNSMTSAASRTRSIYAIMEGHLRTMLALQMQITAMQMAPGTRMNLPMGGTLGRSAKGAITVGVPKSVSASGRTSVGGYANSIATGALIGAAARGAAAGGAGAAAGSIVGVGSRILGFLGGPWGLAASIGIPIILNLLMGIFNSNEESNEKLDQLSNEEWKRRQDDLFIGAIREAARKGIKEGMRDSSNNVRITVNGTPAPSGSSTTLDSDSLLNVIVE